MSKNTMLWKGDVYTIVASKYQDGSTALLMTQNGVMKFRATVSIPDQTPAPGCVFIKNYSENKNILNGLVSRKYMEATGVTISTPYCEDGIVECRLLVDFGQDKDPTPQMYEKFERMETILPEDIQTLIKLNETDPDAHKVVMTMLNSVLQVGISAGKYYAAMDIKEHS